MWCFLLGLVAVSGWAVVILIPSSLIGLVAFRLDKKRYPEKNELLLLPIFGISVCIVVGLVITLSMMIHDAGCHYMRLLH